MLVAFALFLYPPFDLAGELGGEVDIEGDAGAHGGADGERLHVLALCAAGLGLQDGAEASFEVLQKLLIGEVDLSDGHVNDAGFVGSVLDTGRGFDFLNGGGDVVGDGSVSLVGRLGTEGSTDLTDLGGHLFRGEDYVEVSLTGLNLGDEIIRTDDVGASLFGFGGEVSLRKDGDLLDLAGSVGEVGEAANVLITLSRIDAESDREVYALNELGGGGLLYEGDRAVDVQGGILVDLLGNLDVPRRLRVLADVLSQIVHLWCRRLKEPPTRFRDDTLIGNLGGRSSG